MKPGYIALALVAILIVGGAVYFFTRPSSSSPLLSGGGPQGGSTGTDQTASDVSTVITGAGTGLGALFSGIADLMRAGRNPPAEDGTQTTRQAIRSVV